LCSPQATQIFSRSGVCSLGLFHTTAQVAAAWHPLAEQIAELIWSLIWSAWQVGWPSLHARRELRGWARTANTPYVVMLARRVAGRCFSRGT
jgi:hypothetical protein